MIWGYSAQHEKWFQENTNKILFRQMCLAKGRHFQPEVAKALKDTGKVDVDAQETNKKQSKHGNRSKSKGAKPKRRSKSGKGRGRGRGGKGKKRKGSELDDDDLDEDDLDGEDDLQEDGEEDQDRLLFANGKPISHHLHGIKFWWASFLAESWRMMLLKLMKTQKKKTPSESDSHQARVVIIIWKKMMGCSQIQIKLILFHRQWHRLFHIDILNSLSLT